MAFENLFVRTKRTIGGIQLDTVIVEDHDNSVTITKNPVEAGVDITDHAIIQPKILFIRGAVTDTPLGGAAFGLLIDSITNLFGTSTESNVTRSQTAYDLFLTLMENREPLDITTGLRIYENMLLTRLTTSQDKDSSRIVFLDMTFEEILLTESTVIDLTEADVDASISKNITSTSDRGRQNAIDNSAQTNTTLLLDLANWLGGGGG